MSGSGAGSGSRGWTVNMRPGGRACPAGATVCVAACGGAARLRHIPVASRHDRATATRANIQRSGRRCACSALAKTGISGSGGQACASPPSGLEGRFSMAFEGWGLGRIAVLVDDPDDAGAGPQHQDRRYPVYDQ
ncbi:Uncharacterised protein [Bordetella pertussis]|nr:Uncharacterised protein [Bordetella pertussis]